jgi:hypothetical protein
MSDTTANGSDGRAAPYGIGGWLVFFIFSIGIISPAFGLAGVCMAIWGAEARHPSLIDNVAWKHYKLFSWAAIVVCTAWEWWVAYGLWNRFVPRSVFHAKLMLVLLPVLTASATAIALNVLLGGRIDLERVYVRFLLSAIVPAAWFLYFVYSKRVRNTYFPTS